MTVAAATTDDERGWYAEVERQRPDAPRERDRVQISLQRPGRGGHDLSATTEGHTEHSVQWPPLV